MQLTARNIGYMVKLGSSAFVTELSIAFMMFLGNYVFISHLGEDGVAVTGKNTIDGKEYTFDENGKFVRGSFVEEVVKDKKGKDVTITRYYTAGGSYALMWQEIDGNLYYFQNSGKEMGRMLSGGQWIITTRGKNTKRTYTFAKDGKLTVGISGA